MFDLSAPETVQDPFPAYAWLREEEPVHWWASEHHPRGGMWLVSRYADARAVLADDRFTKRGETVGLPSEAPPILMFLDPPEHTRQRRYASRSFTRRQVERLRDAMAEEVAALTAPVVDGETFDVVERLAMPLPLHAICRLLGVPLEDAAHLHELSRQILDSGDLASRTEDSVEIGRDAVRRLLAYLNDHVTRTAAAPGSDLTSAMLADDADEGGLTPQEIATMGAQLLVNGHGTAVDLIGTALYHLLDDREQWERLVADPSLVEPAIEECLRFDPPNTRSSSRYALEPIEIGGVSIGEGEQVSAVIASANRDPDVFADADRLDVGRTPNPHLTFGHGRHHCPGAALARLELAAVLHHLTRSAPDLELVDRHPTYRPSSFDRGLVSLAVARR